MVSKKILHASIVILFLVLSFVINEIPAGTFIAGGDFYQLIEINDNLDRNLFTWFNQIGQGQYNPLIVTYPFYIIQYCLYNIGFSYSNIANAVIFIFLISSFYSFFFATKIINENIPNNIKLLSSAIYAINNFTFTIFVHPWGFSNHFAIYIFIPLLFAFFERCVSRYLTKDIVYFTVLFLISTMGFNNIAFLAALLFLQALLSIALFATKKFPLKILTMKRIIFIFILELFLSIYFILPFISSQFEYLTKITGGKIIGNIVTIFSFTSNNVYSIFSFTIYPDRYPLNNLYSDSNMFVALTLGYIIFLMVAILYQKGKQEKHWLHYMIVLLVLFFLLMRGTVPFDTINLFIYSLPGFNLFRSADKLFTFYPFFYLISLTLLLYYTKFSKRIINSILIIILIIPIPFYIGGIPKYLSHEFQDEYKYTIQIPIEYYKIKELINKDDSQLSIISLPYNVVNSINWANYPNWHFVGNDVLNLLYNKFYITANAYDHPFLETNLSFEEYNEAKIIDNERFLKLLQKFSGKYILLHKDIKKGLLDESRVTYNTIKQLEANNIIRKLDENEYFTLYELNKNYLVPLIFSDKNYLSFQKSNPTKYKIYLSNLTSKINIEFHQSHNSQWKLYLASDPNNLWCKQSEYYTYTKTTECEYTKKIFEISDLTYIWKKPIFEDTHTMVDEYANSWTIDPEYIKENYPKEFYKQNKDGSIDIEMTLYFNPQSYFYIGVIISGFTLMGCLSYLARDCKRKRKKDKE